MKFRLGYPLLRLDISVVKVAERHAGFTSLALPVSSGAVQDTSNLCCIAVDFELP